MSSPSQPEILPKLLGVWDVAAITAGIIIGAGIYESTPLIAMQVSHPGMLLLLWVVGGLIALNGALCYAELASAYPREGGTFVYLNKAWGSWAGFLYAWCEFWVVRPGNIGAMAFIFAKYAEQVAPGLAGSGLALAIGVVVTLAAVNLLGVRAGKRTQSVLTIAKLGGLVAIFAIGMFATAPASDTPSGPLPWFSSGDNLALAMVFILFAYGGWNETAAVAAEVSDPQRNVRRGLVLGTLLVISSYLLVNIALVRGLGFEGLRSGDAVAATLVSRVLGPWGAQAISISVCISCLGAINGMLFTGARLYYALGVEEPAFHWLGHWNRERGTPLRALVLQTVVALVLILVFGWSGNGFQQLVIFTAPVFWSFLLLVSLAVISLRLRDGQTPRPFKLPFFPLEPLIFAASSSLMIYSGLSYLLSRERDFAFWFSAGATILPAVAGLVLFALTRERGRGARNLDD